MKYLHPTRASFALLDKPLSFDDVQDEVLRRRPPLVLVGSAGSGKTALLLQQLRVAPGRVAYVTESAWLAQAARGLYVAHGWDPGEQEADFLSYRQFLESIEVPDGRAVSFRDFVGFDKANKIKKRARAQIIANHVTARPHEDRHHLFEMGRSYSLDRHGDAPGAVTRVGCRGVAEELRAHDGFQAVCADENVTFHDFTVGEMHLHPIRVFDEAGGAMVDVDDVAFQAAGGLD